jgi:hypothetical protein
MAVRIERFITVAWVTVGRGLRFRREGTETGTETGTGTEMGTGTG